MRRARPSTTLLILHALALLALALALAFTASPARAESWGELTHFKLEAGKNPAEAVGKVVEHQLVKFAAGSDGSYYVLTGNTNNGEFDLQRFDEGKMQAEAKFNRPQKQEGLEETEKLGSEGTDATLAVDPARDRVYVLLTYERRVEQNTKEVKAEEKEEEEEEKGEKPKGSAHPIFPLDASMPATGSLYAFEYESAKKELVSKKTAKEGDVPQLTREKLHGQGENPKEALLDPRGMAVDPVNGDLVISGNQDEESNEEVEQGAEKQCRAALQFVKVEETGGGAIKKLEPTSRYVDKEGKVLFGEVGPGHGCGEEEEEDGVEQAPASPVFAPDGSILGYGEDEEVGPGHEGEEGPRGVIWQLAPAGADEHAPGEVLMEPKELFVAGSLPSFNPVIGEEQADTIMSMVPEPGSKTEGTLYLSGSYAPNGQPSPAVLHYANTGEPSISEVGWTAGGTVNENLGPEPCDLHKVAVGPAMLGGVILGGKHGLLALTYYKENEGAGHEQVVPRAEVVEFGEGGSTKGCPVPKLTTPAQYYHEVPTNELPLDDVAEIFSTTVEREKSTPSAGAKSVKWTVKLNGSLLREHSESFDFNGLTAEEYGYGFILGLEQEFNKEGTYEITDVVHSDDLADEVVQSAVDKVTVKGAKLVLTPKTPEPATIAAHEGKAKLAVAVKEEPSEAGFAIKHVLWEFGDGTRAEQSVPAETLTSPVSIEHEFSRCGASEKTTCKIKVTVEAETGTNEHLTQSAEFEITVDENAVEKKEEEQKKEEEHTTTTSSTTTASASTSTGTSTSTSTTTSTTTTTTPPAEQGVAGYIASFAGSSLSVNSSGALSVTISCPSGDACKGTLTLQTATPVATSSKKHAPRKILTLASASFSLPGGSRAVTLHLNSTGKTLLARSHGKLPAKLTVMSLGTGAEKNSSATHVVTLRQAPAKKSHK